MLPRLPRLSGQESGGRLDVPMDSTKRAASAARNAPQAAAGNVPPIHRRDDQLAFAE
jgi:hypothetical protein